jgi:hypothetical protein
MVALLRAEHALEQRGIAGGLELDHLPVAIGEHVDLVSLPAFDRGVRQDHDTLIV